MWFQLLGCTAVEGNGEVTSDCNLNFLVEMNYEFGQPSAKETKPY